MASRPLPAPAGQPELHSPNRPEPVLVGRSTELDALISSIVHPPAVAMVEGEAGIGKTRLIREAVRNRAVRDRRVLLGDCLPLREPFPYGPVFDLLHRLTEDLAGDSGIELNPVCGALRRYLPEVAEVLPPTPEPLHDPRSEQHRLFRAVRTLLEAVGPTVMVIEDLHWADDGTRELLRFLVADPPPALSVVLSYRREDLPVGRLPLGHAHRHVPGVASVVLPLQPLEPPDVRRLCSGLTGTGRVPGEVAAEIHRRTAGIPLVVEEMVGALPERALDGDGDQARDALDQMTVPAMLQEAIIERLNRLSTPAVAAVRAVAVLRIPADEDVIAHLMQAAVDRIDGSIDGSASSAGAAIREALASRVLHETDPGLYGFRHALAQQAVYESLPGPDRRRLHRQAVAVLDRQPARPLRHLAYHARLAGDRDRWRRYAEAAADAARRMGDVALAVEVLEELLSQAQLDRADRARIAVELSRDAVVGLSHRRVTDVLRGVIDDDSIPDTQRGEIRLNLGLLLSNQVGEYEQGRADTELAVEELHQRPDLAARAMAALAMPSRGDHPFRCYHRWIERAESLLGDNADPAVVTAVRATRLSLMMSAGDPTVWSRVDEMLADATDLSAPEHDVRQIARACCNFSDAAIVTGHFDTARRFREVGRRLAEQCGASFFEGLIEGTSLRLDWYTGSWKGLADRARDTLSVVRDTSGIAADAHLVLGFLSSAVGEWDTAAAEFAAAGLADPANAPGPILAAAAGGLVRVQLARGDLDAARAETDRAVARIRRKELWAWAGDLAPMAVRAMAGDGDLTQAERFTDELADAITDRDAPAAAAAVPACRGIIALTRSRTRPAIAAFRTAYELYRQMGQPYEAARTLEAVHRCQLPDDNAAAGLLALADEFTGLGAVRDAARCRQALRSNQVMPPSRRGRRGYGDQLSPRETEVARMVARGHTNREIADILYLSPRTVEQHVARVLRKLDVSSRSDVTLG